MYTYKTIAKRNAFTLVELIVVITILAILGTIGFLSFQNYNKSARDSKRVNDVRVVEKGLSFYSTQTNSLPLPDEKINITASGILLGYQGKVGSGVLTTIRQAGEIVDPVSGENYTYFRDELSKNYNILAFMEEPQGQIETNNRYVKVFGNGLGLLKHTSTNSPIESYHSNDSFDIFNTTEDHTFIADSNTYFTSSGTELGSFVSLPSDNLTIHQNNTSLIGFLNPSLSGSLISGKEITTTSYGNLNATSQNIECNGSRIVLNSIPQILGDSDEFTIYVSYILDSNQSSSYPLLFSSFGVSNGYNVACQHNVTGASPGISCYARVKDDIGNVTGHSFGSQSINYDEKQEIFISVKDGQSVMYINDELIEKKAFSGTLNTDSGTGFGVCARPSGGYSLRGLIYKIYIADFGVIGDSNIENFKNRVSTQ